MSDNNNRITEMWQKWNYSFKITKEIKNYTFCQSAQKLMRHSVTKYITVYLFSRIKVFCVCAKKKATKKQKKVKLNQEVKIFFGSNGSFKCY